MRLLLALSAVPVLFAVQTHAATTESHSDKPALECRILSAVEKRFLDFHVKYSSRDKELETRTIEQNLKRIDPSKIYLTQADVEKVKGWMSGLFDKTKNADCAFLTKSQELLTEKVKARAEMAKNFLGKDYKFDSKAEFTYDPDHKPWPKDEKEAEDFLKKYIHFQVANYLATDLKIEEAKDRVAKNYERAVRRTLETTMDDIYSGYLDSYARALDPHSSFFSRDVLEDFNIQMSLSLEGIGATLSSEDGFTKVEALVPGGAAARSGLVQPLDKIIAVGQAEGPMENVIDMDLKDVVKKIRGAKNTKVRLTLLRSEAGKKNRVNVTVTRDKVSLEDEAASVIYMDKTINGKKQKIGLINFPSFYADSRRGGRSSAADMKALIKEARAKKVTGLVLDLSNNGGGSLEDAVKIAGLFFKTGNVVKQSSKTKGEEQTLADEDPMVDWPGPLVVLTSRISASASEIVAGTLQDYKRAVIVGGDHTFGKGSVQSVWPMPYNLGAIKVTVGMFFVPGGNSTQHRGVAADVVLPGPYSTDDVGEKFLDYSLPPAQLPAFTSAEASVDKGADAWNPVQDTWVKTLKDKSKERVDKSADFKKVIEDLAKTKERGKVIRVSEVLDEEKDKEKKEKKEKAKTLRYGKKSDRDKEYLKRADVQESANVLVDLIQAEDSKSTGPQASAK